MTGNANSKILTRVIAVAFIALAFAGCAAMFVKGDHSLFSEPSYSDIAH